MTEDEHLADLERRISALEAGVVTPKIAASFLARASRVNPTPAQSAASRENGKKGGEKGGRPRKNALKGAEARRKKPNETPTPQ